MNESKEKSNNISLLAVDGLRHLLSPGSQQEQGQECPSKDSWTADQTGSALQRFNSKNQ